MKALAVNRITPLWLSCLLLVTSTACEDVVDIDVPQSQAEIVISGMVSDSLPVEVELSLTDEFFGEGSPPVISNAQVKLLENGQEVSTLQESNNEPGLYTSPFRGELGNKYQVEVSVTGDYPDQVLGTWRSQPELMKRVPDIDSLKIVYLDRNTQPRAFNPGNYALLYFQELPGQGDIYRIRRWLSDSSYRTPQFVIEDEQVDGLYFGRNIPPISLHGPFHEDDSITQPVFRLQLESITRSYADFLQILSEQTNVGSPFDAPPALVIGNIYNTSDTTIQGFGYFRASSVRPASIRYAP